MSWLEQPIVEFKDSSSIGVRRKIGVLKVARDNQIVQGIVFLVGKCLAITAARTAARTAVVGNAGSSVQKVHRYFGHGLRFDADGMPLAWGIYYRRRTQKANGDWAVLRVKPCLSEKLGCLRLNSIAKNTAVKIGKRRKYAGYSIVRGNRRLTVARKCRIIRASDHTLGGGLNDCSLRRGGSDGPILWHRRVIAVATAETAGVRGRLKARASRRLANITVSASAILNRLKLFHLMLFSEMPLDQGRVTR